MDEKTKEIVERLQKVLDAPESWREHDTEALSVAIVPVQDILDAVIELKNNASLIERLSERVGELERPPVANASACEDCGRPYDGPGFPDLIIPLAIWKQISTHGDETGLLCPSCLIARLDRAGLESVPAAFAGRAVESVTYETMAALRESENDALLSKQEERG